MYISLIFGTILSVLICISGDKYGSLSIFQHPRLAVIRALIDNITHGLVGCVSWWLVVGFKQPKLSIFNTSRINQSLFCLFLSSVIDIDHFIAAGSIYIQDIISLPHRPPLHCSGLCLLITAALWFMTGYYPGMHLLPWEWLISFSSHHVRDATRRGLWIIPWILTTQPLPYYLYLTLIALIPPLVAAFAPIQTVVVVIANKTIITV